VTGWKYRLSHGVRNNVVGAFLGIIDNVWGILTLGTYPFSKYHWAPGRLQLSWAMKRALAEGRKSQRKVNNAA
jgi:hypothetical protein